MHLSGEVGVSILTEVTLLLPTAAEIRPCFIAINLVQEIIIIVLRCWTPVILSCLNSKAKLIRFICSQSIKFYYVNGFVLVRVQCLCFTLENDAGGIQTSKTEE